MAQKKKKGKPPQSEKPRKKKTTSQIVFTVFGILIALLMVFSAILPSLGF